MKIGHLICSVLAAMSPISLLLTEAAAQVAYTEEQAMAGGVAYEEYCAECHLQTLLGSFEAPELAGQNFLNYWSGRPVQELMEMAISMPPGEENSLGEAVYTNIVAYLLDRNGFPSGSAQLLADATGILEGSLGPLEIPPTSPAQSTDAMTTPLAASGRNTGGTSTFREITDFRPVTDEDLVNPDPGDWLLYRRT